MRHACVAGDDLRQIPLACRTGPLGGCPRGARSRAVKLQARRYVRQDGILARHDGWALFALVEQASQGIP
jgi:hypothetical protein